MKYRYFQDMLIFLLVLFILFLIKIPYLSVTLSAGIILTYSALKNGVGKELGFVWPPRLHQLIGIAVLIALALVGCSFFIFQPAIELITNAPYDLGPFAQLQNNPKLLWISIGIGWIIGGFMEEIIFRGFMLSRITTMLPGKFGILSGILFTAFIFGLLHNYQGATGQLLTGLIGAILGGIYLLNKRRIWLNILVHGFVNTISMVLLFKGVLN